MKKRSVVQIGLGQINPTVGDFVGNTKKICSYIEASEVQGLDLVIFPELAVSGYPVWDLANKTAFVEKGLKSLRQIANATCGKHVTAVVGFIDSAGETQEKNYNALAVIRNGKIVAKQYKTLLPTYDVFLEEIFFSPAKSQRAFSLNGLLFGLSICEDIWDDQYQVKPAKILAQKGARVLINISASPYHKEVVARRSSVILRKAREYRLWIIYVNQVGGQDDLIFDGRSFICDPKGRICFEGEPFKEALYRVQLDLRALMSFPRKRESRMLDPRLRGGDNPYETVSSKSFGQVDVVQEVYQALCLGLSDYVRKNKFRKVVVGLSGGIDSALVATIARDALGPDAVIGVSMPGPYSSRHSIKDAKDLAGRLGIEFRIKPIRPHYVNFVKSVVADKKERGVKAIEKNSITLAMENLQARLRGLELMYLSNDEGALLLSTGNKSELAMGYSTLYGDMCGGLSVLGDVYKTEVYRLARYRNSLSKVIPDSSLKKAPSAELRPHQKDQDSLPPYSALDQILCLYIEGNKNFGEISRILSKKNISAKTVKHVLHIVDRNEYKRRQLPPSLRITEKAWFGRRMPITNRFEE